LKVKISEFKELPEWSSTITGVYGNPQSLVKELYLLLQTSTPLQRGVFYCVPWQTSLYNPELDGAIRKVARVEAAGLMLVLGTEELNITELPWHLIDIARRLHVNLLLCQSANFHSVWAAAVQRITTVELNNLRRMQERLGDMNQMARSCRSVEEFIALLNGRFGWHLHWNARSEHTASQKHRVSVAGETVGYLIAEDADEQLGELLPMVGTVAASIHLSDMSKIESKLHFHNDLLQVMLEPQGEPELLLTAARRAKLNPAATTYIVLFTQRFGLSDSAQQSVSWTQVLFQIQRHLEHGNIPHLAGFADGYPTLLFQPHRPVSGHESQTVDVRLNLLLEASAPPEVIAGVSSPHLLKTGCTLAFREALEAVTISQALDRPERIVQHAGLGKDRLFYSLLTSPVATMLPRKLLQPLLEADRTVHTDYIRTLTAYFTHDRKLLDTARSLNLHRNTLRYRLSQMENILGLRFDNPEQALLLQIAILAQRVYGGQQFPAQIPPNDAND